MDRFTAVVKPQFTPCADIAATVSELATQIGPGARICAMPEGPQTIAYVA